MKKCILFLCALLLLAALAGCGGQTSVDTGSPGDAQTDAPPEGQSLNYNADTVPETPVTATSLPRGTSTQKGLTVCRPVDSM